MYRWTGEETDNAKCRVTFATENTINNSQILSASVPSFNFKSSIDSNGKSELNFTTQKTMPDITNNILSKSLRTDKLKGKSCNKIFS